RYPDALRFGVGRFDTGRILNQWILLPPGTPAPGPTAPNLAGPARAVPLSALASVKPVRTPDQQFRENQLPAMIVTADLNEDEAGLGPVVADIRGWMGGVSLPAA